MYKNILLPTDGSELSEKAIRAGIKLAKTINAKVTGVYVIPEPTPGDIWDIWTPETAEGKRFRERFEETLKCLAERYLSKIEEIAKEEGVLYECLYTHGESISEEILKVAKDKNCDLIFMASHSRKVVSQIIGSVTLKVISRTDIPVLVYR